MLPEVGRQIQDDEEGHVQGVHGSLEQFHNAVEKDVRQGSKRPLPARQRQGQHNTWSPRRGVSGVVSASSGVGSAPHHSDPNDVSAGGG